MVENNKFNIVSPICRVAKLLAVEPFYNASSFGMRLQKCYAIFLVIALNCGYVASLYGKITETYARQNFTVVIIDAMSLTVLTAAITTAVIRSSFCNVEKFKTYMEYLGELRQMLKQERITNVMNNRFYIETIIAHIAMVLLLTFDGFVWVKTVGVRIYTRYLFKDVTDYINMIVVLLIYNYVMILRNCFQKTNCCLSNINNNCSKRSDSAKSEVKINNYVNNEKEDAGEKVKTVRKMYALLSALVRICNTIFGWQIFFLCAIVLMGVLEVVNFTLVITVVENGRFMDNVALEADFISLIFLWCFSLAVS